MSILVNKDTKIVVQGITGKEGRFHANQCNLYGGNVVGGVSPGKGGATVEGIPVFNTVAAAVETAHATCSLIFVPPPFAADAIVEAVDSGIEFIVCITEGIPIRDMMMVAHYMKNNYPKTILLGPNCPGIITPNEAKVGILPGHIFSRGRIGVISRSGTLTYEAAYQLTGLGIGQSTAVGIGGDPISGLSHKDVVEMFENDPETDAILMIGEIGGTSEEEAAEFIVSHVKKPVFAYIAGTTAPPGRRMGHAGAIVTGGKGTAESKIKSLNKAGVHTIDNAAFIGKTIKETLKY
ncbi:MAG: succinyl-CoA synthetase, alpha subunit [Firmicutes bacterium]|nr:succinyl-CoA synthetase, alpha subunit [Bacillota bacterium]